MHPVRLARWWTALAIFIAAVALLVGLMMIILSLMPDVRGKLRCKSNMIAVGRALQRYYWPNEKYPPNLEALRRDYLKDPNVLRCPLDRSPDHTPSYTYTRPTPDAPDDTIILSCDRHRNAQDDRVLFILTKGVDWDSIPFESAPAPPQPAVPAKEYRRPLQERRHSVEP